MDGSFTGVDSDAHHRHENEDMADAVMEAVMEYAGRVSLVEALGVLRLVGHRLLTEVHWDNV